MVQDKKKSLCGKIFSPINLILGGTGIAGILLIWLTSGFWIHIGVALFVTGLLGLTIDKYLKRELSKEAVKAALGYVLPDPLKEEMRWVVGLKFLATEHTIKYNIHTNEDGKTVRLSIEMTRRLWNFTEVSQSIKPTLSIDEMGIEGKPSQIQEFCCQLQDHSWTYADLDKIRYTEDGQYLEAPEIRVPPNKWIQINSKFYETKHINDDHFIVLSNPTNKPAQHVTKDAGIEHRTGFTHRDKAEDDILQGTLLPYHSAYIRWWPSKQKD